MKDDEIKTIMEAAFKLLRCAAEIWDYDQKLRFRVFDHADTGIVNAPNLTLRHLRDRAELQKILKTVRETVTDKGFRLDPWELE